MFETLQASRSSRQVVNVVVFGRQVSRWQTTAAKAPTIIADNTVGSIIGVLHSIFAARFAATLSAAAFACFLLEDRLDGQGGCEG